MGQYHLPNFPIPQDFKDQDPNNYLKSLCMEGLQKDDGEISPDISP